MRWTTPTTGRARPAHELQWAKLLNIFIDLCHAVAYAHSRGVLHRDVKPDNVMLGPYGETLVLDWGIAKVVGHHDVGSGISGDCDSAGISGGTAGTGSVRTSVGSGSTDTIDGTLLGTPSYMAPEMAEGHASQTDERSDVYLLGATLYEILTGQMPRSGSGRDELIEMARTVAPPPARKVRADCPRLLEAIALKAMALRKESRYPSAMALADDVERYLAGEAVSAYRDGVAARTWRWCRRHRRSMQRAPVVAVIVTLCGLTAALWLRAAALRNRESARADLQQFFNLADQARFYAASTDSADERAPAFDPVRGQGLAEQALAIAQHWGYALERWPLPQDLPRLRGTLYDLLLLDAHLRSAQQDDSKQAMALLDQAALLEPRPTRGFYRIRARIDPAHANDDRRRADATDTPSSSADLFLLGEHLRRQSGGVDAQRSPDALQSALQAYRDAVAVAPGDYWAQFQLGRCFLSVGQPDQAVAALSTCIALRPDAQWAYSTRGIVLALLNRHDEAMRDLNAAVSLQPDFAPALVNRGFCQWLQHNDAEALADFEAALHPRAGEGLIEAAYYRGELHIDRAQYADAVTDFNAVVAKLRGFARARLLLAEAHLLLGDSTACRADLDALLLEVTHEAPANDADAARARGHLLRGLLPNLSPMRAHIIALQAQRELQHAVQLGEQNAELYADLGAVTERTTGYADAVVHFSRSLALSDDPAVRLRRGCALLKLRQLDQATADFAQAVHLDPTNAKAHFWLGYANVLAGTHTAAMREAVVALSQGADDYADLHNVACIFAQFARTDPASASDDLDVCVALLRRAVAIWQTRPIGPNEPELIRAEPDFQISELQSRADFRALQSAASPTTTPASTTR